MLIVTAAAASILVIALSVWIVRLIRTNSEFWLEEN